MGRMGRKKVFVSGCYDLLHSGHVEFFRRASKYGDVYVALGSDKTIEKLKNRPTINQENERLYMVRAIRHVKEAFIAGGSGMLDFESELRKIKPHVFIVNEDGDRPEKRKLCRVLGIKYIVLKRIPARGLPRRSTTELRKILQY
jgi:cytidyltransferase-like protein